MMSLWDALRMNMMISYQELVRTFLKRTGDNKDISSACAHWQHKSREGAEDEDETAACDAG